MHKGFNELSRVKQNKNYQIKKLYSSATKEEKLMLAKSLASIQKLTRSPHFIENQQSGKISFDLHDIMRTLHSRGLLNAPIEYNETYSGKNNRIQQRVLLKLDGTYQVKLRDNRTGCFRPTPCFAFVVIDLTTSEVVTGYYNSIYDNHKTLDINRYNNEMEIRPVKKGGYSVKEKQGFHSNENNKIVKA